ncbi:Acetyl-CoA acetyltransferase [Corynebacterium deserti GIMN1.010]|uniref:Probable acetyl-CoA acetyltransferase n=2 Tax=Corynebacterium TaxID=1716 RepID=A0A0M4CID7_9CORY|nr:thiolase family protein [Corynebacterium deserti]ALC07115.1 Acetyl-CoA acetyltransferase [Corynebacterium deserti GIMN1.010]
MTDNKIVFLGGARTAVGTFGGTLAKVPTHELGAHAMKAALSRSNVPAEKIDEVIIGCVGQVGEEAFLARRIALKAGARDDSNAMTVNRLCGSGLQAVQSAALELRSGDSKYVVAGGAENMSLQPFLDYGARDGWRLGSRTLIDGTQSLVTDPFGNYPMGNTAEAVAAEFNVSRKDQDEFAAESQRRAAAAQEAGFFNEEIEAIEVKERHNTVIFDKDEHPRAGSTFEKLSTLRPAFIKDGTVTAGNSSGINDAAAALVMTTASTAHDDGLSPIGELVAFARAGIRPEIMGYAPKLATERVLEKAGLTTEDMDWIEVNEAFAAQAVAVVRDLGLDPEKVNPLGGAIALGHPVGATGSILTLRTLIQMKRTGGELGLITMCIGGGQAVAAIVRVLN